MEIRPRNSKTRIDLRSGGDFPRLAQVVADGAGRVLVEQASGLIPVEDRLLTFGSAARALGVGYHTIQRAAKKGLLTTYSLGTSRRYVRLRDIFEIVSR